MNISWSGCPQQHCGWHLPQIHLFYLKQPSINAYYNNYHYYIMAMHTNALFTNSPSKLMHKKFWYALVLRSKKSEKNSPNPQSILVYRYQMAVITNNVTILCTLEIMQIFSQHQETAIRLKRKHSCNSLQEYCTDSVDASYRKLDSGSTYIALTSW